MKKYFIFALCAFVSVGLITGCGKKKENTESADKRLEKTFKAYSMEKTADDSSDIEAVENVTIVGNFNVKTSEMNMKSAIDFKVDLKGQEFYLGGNVSVEDDKIGFDVYGSSDDENDGVFYVRADEFLEDWLKITFNNEDMELTDEEETEEFDIDELLKVDFSAFKDIKEIETKNGITKISAKLDLESAYEEEIENSNMDAEIPELTIYFYIDEDDRLTKVEFDGEELIESGMFDTYGVEVEEVEMSFEFKDYGTTKISIPEAAKNTTNVISAEDLITSVLTLFLGDMNFEDTDLNYDFNFDELDLSDDSAAIINE